MTMLDPGKTMSWVTSSGSTPGGTNRTDRSFSKMGVVFEAAETWRVGFGLVVFESGVRNVRVKGWGFRGADEDGDKKMEVNCRRFLSNIVN